MEKRDERLLSVTNEMVTLVSKLRGGDDPLARYDSHNPDSLGRMIEWYHRNAGEVLRDE